MAKASFEIRRIPRDAKRRIVDGELEVTRDALVLRLDKQEVVFQFCFVSKLKHGALSTRAHIFVPGRWAMRSNPIFYWKQKRLGNLLSFADDALSQPHIHLHRALTPLRDQICEAIHAYEAARALRKYGIGRGPCPWLAEDLRREGFFAMRVRAKGAVIHFDVAHLADPNANVVQEARRCGQYQIKFPVETVVECDWVPASRFKIVQQVRLSDLTRGRREPGRARDFFSASGFEALQSLALASCLKAA